MVEQFLKSKADNFSKETFISADRISYLMKDRGLITAKNYGEILVDYNNLLDWVSTDEIIPSQWCMQYSDSDNLGRHLLTGIDGIEAGDIQNSGINVLVVGESFGRGSSREHAQLALQGAGIKLVIAKSSERIFRENCRNYGIFVLPLESDVSEKLLKSEIVEWDEVVSQYDDFTSQIYSYGGLLPYTKARIEGLVSLPVVKTPLREMTIAEKIIAKKTKVDANGEEGVVAVKPGDVLIAKVDKKYAYELQTILSQQGLKDVFGENVSLSYLENTWLFEDHLALMPDDKPVTKRHRDAQREFAKKYGIPEYRAGENGVEGICHTVMLEKHVLPGELVLGNDSHTCHLGAVNSLAIGKGASEFAASLLTGDTPIEVPATIKINLLGKLPREMTTTDVMLSIISRDDFKNGIASEKVLQFGGEALNEISVDEQTTFTNMSIEGLAYTGVVEPNEKLIEFIMKKHGLDRDSVLNMLVFPDKYAKYEKVINIDLSTVKRMVSLPGDTQNAVPISEVKGTRVKYFYIGSCKQGNEESLRLAASLLKGHKIAEGVIMQAQANTEETESRLRAEGILNILEESGVEIIARGCGPCMGATEDANEREEVVFSATDRNFKGRMGKYRKVYLGDVPAVVASAMRGEICEPEDLALAA